MPFTYDIDAREGHVSIVGSDSVSMTGMIAVVEEVAADARFAPSFTVAFDLRGARYTAELSDGDALAAVLRQKKSHFQSRFAVVVSPSLHFLAKLYCVLATVGGFDKIQCFTDIEEARKWCRDAKEGASEI